MRRLARSVLAGLAAAAVAALILPASALAGGNSVAQNLGSLAREYAGELYTGIVAVFALVFLMGRRFTLDGALLHQRGGRGDRPRQPARAGAQAAG